MSNLVIINGDKAFTTTLVIADGVRLEHKRVMNLLRKHSNTETLKTFKKASEKRIGSEGKPIVYAELSEKQASFLITLMRNSEKVVEFKEKLNDEFFKQRQIISNLIQQRNDPNWQNVRKDGKAIYLQKTEVIKEFVEYATEQGSTSAKKYYMVIGKMENKALFFLEQKYKNLREALTIKQLMQVSTADDVIEKALREGMDRKMPYKEIFQLAKERIIAYAEIIGKSPILALEVD